LKNLWKLVLQVTNKSNKALNSHSNKQGEDTMNTPVDMLVEEHNVIERMLVILNKASDRLEGGEQVPAEFFLNAVDFIRHFADKCHHAKEEDVLFKLMGRRGIPSEGGPIGQMLTEHSYARQYTSRLETAAKHYEQGNQAAKEDIIENARAYAQLLSSHIFKENNILYPMAGQVFSDQDHEYLLQEFERVESEISGEGQHEKYHHLVEEMEAHLGMVTAEHSHHHHHHPHLV